ncbi:MAG: hypothetical protein H6Q00_2196 [Holophagaceae bacterium]|nr:hypothetical protein [Holophagaceae bacterium]
MRALVLLVPALVSLHGQDGVSFEKLHHDFGKISADRRASYRFKVFNRGKVPVQIKQVVPSCGCTSTVAGQWYIKPGESTELEIAFDPKGFRGVVHKSVQVIGEVLGTETMPFNQTLTFQAEVIRDIVPSTSTLFFNEVPRTGTRKSTFTLASGNGQAVKVKRVEIPGAPFLSANVRPNGLDAVIEVNFEGKAVPPGKTSGVETLTAQIENNPQNPYVRTSIQWDLKARIHAAPERVAWVDTAGKELRANLVLTHADAKPFRVLSAQCTSPLLRVEGLGAPAAAKHELKVVLGADNRGGVLNEWITFQTDDPDQPELKLRVSAVLR